MTSQERAERENVITRVLGARTVAEIYAAETALIAWLQIHPADVAMEDGFEQLATMREAAEAGRPEPAAAATAAEGGSV